VSSVNATDDGEGYSDATQTTKPGRRSGGDVSRAPGRAAPGTNELGCGKRHRRCQCFRGELGKITQLLDLRPLDNLLEAHEAIRRGLPVHSVEHLIETLPALPIDQALEAALGMSARTLQRKRAAGTKSLNPEQSGRVWKFAEVLAKARDVFGSSEQAATWLSRPATGLNQQRPIDLLATLAGAELVQRFLGRLEYGVYT
jgi:putative toxin-antitoxin system antitoxin component (TIGR02293 family)